MQKSKNNGLDTKTGAHLLVWADCWILPPTSALVAIYFIKNLGKEKFIFCLLKKFDKFKLDLLISLSCFFLQRTMESK